MIPPHSTGGTESDFPELQTAREFSEDEDTGSLGWATPRELTFSYIAFTPGHDASPPRDARTRRDSGARRPRGGLGAGPGPTPPRPEPPGPALGDSLENIPSLCQSPEGERGQGLGLDPFSAWDAPLRYTNDPEPLEPGNSPPPQPQLVPTTKATVDPGATKVTEAAAGSGRDSGAPALNRALLGEAHSTGFLGVALLEEAHSTGGPGRALLGKVTALGGGGEGPSLELPGHCWGKACSAGVPGRALLGGSLQHQGANPALSLAETALEVAPGDLQLTPALALHPAEGTPCRAEGTLSSSCTLEGPGFQGPWDAKDPQEEKAFLEMEPIPEQRLEELDQSGNPMEAYNMGEPPMRREQLGQGRGIAAREAGHCCGEAPSLGALIRCRHDTAVGKFVVSRPLIGSWQSIIWGKLTALRFLIGPPTGHCCKEVHSIRPVIDCMQGTAVWKLAAPCWVMGANYTPSLAAPASLPPALGSSSRAACRDGRREP